MRRNPPGPLRRLWLAAAAIALTACAGIKPIEPKAEQLQAIRSIAVVSAPEPAPYAVLYLGHPAYALGALGGAIVAADQTDKQTRLAQALQPHAPATTERLSQEVVAHLKRMGYDARRSEARWNKADAAGRVTRADGDLSALLRSDRNLYQQVKAGEIGGQGYEGGHLIGSLFGGAGEKINLVPQLTGVNRGAYRDMERTWANAIRDGKTVRVEVAPVYAGDQGALLD